MGRKLKPTLLITIIIFYNQNLKLKNTSCSSVNMAWVQCCCFSFCFYRKLLYLSRNMYVELVEYDF